MIGRIQMIKSKITTIANKIANKVESKNNDYGNAFEKGYNKYGWYEYLVVLNHKLNRIEALTIHRKSQKVKDESLEDTISDIVGYSLQMLRILNGMKNNEVNSMKKIVYIAGPITGIDNYKTNFNNAVLKLKMIDNNIEVINPALIELHESATREDYMKVCYAMLDMANNIYMLPGWEKSKGAKLEYEYALKNGIQIFNAKE